MLKFRDVGYKIDKFLDVAFLADKQKCDTSELLDSFQELAQQTQSGKDDSQIKMYLQNKDWDTKHLGQLLLLAISTDNAQLVRVLLQCKAYFTHNGTRYSTPLSEAIDRKCTQAFTEICKEIDLYAPNEKNIGDIYAPIKQIINSNCAWAMKILLENCGIKIDRKMSDRQYEDEPDLGTFHNSLSPKHTMNTIEHIQFKLPIRMRMANNHSSMTYAADHALALKRFWPVMNVLADFLNKENHEGLMTIMLDKNRFGEEPWLMYAMADHIFSYLQSKDHRWLVEHGREPSKAPDFRKRPALKA